MIDVSFGGVTALAALWCATSPRHWAVRWGVVTALAVVGLLAGAFELILQVVSATGFISLGVATWRAGTGRRPLPRLRSVSVRDLLLATGFCSVTAAVAARTPEFRLFDWGGMVGAGLAIAMVALLAAWLVIGGERWWWRPAGVGVFLAFAMAAYGLRGLWYWYTLPRSRSRFSSLGAAAFDWFSPTQLGWHAAAYGPTLLIGLTMVAVALIGARGSGWFSDRTADQPRWRRGASRAALLVPLVLMGGLDLAVLWRLTHPSPLPPAAPTSVNGWDDIVAAGAMISRADFGPSGFTSLNEQERRALMRKLDPVCERIRLGLSKPTRAWSAFDWLRDESVPELQQQLGDLIDARIALDAKAYDAEQRGDWPAKQAVLLTQLRLEQATLQTASANDVWGKALGGSAVGRLNPLASKLSDARARRVLDALLRFDRHWPPFGELEARQRIVDENSGWSRHLRVLADDWSGVDPYASERRRYLLQQTLLRITIAEYGRRLFQAEQGRPPESLASLVPEYLPQAPLDPFGAGPLRCLRDKEGVSFYSIGADETDDGGRPTSKIWSKDPKGDLTTSQLLSI